HPCLAKDGNPFIIPSPCDAAVPGASTTAGETPAPQAAPRPQRQTPTAIILPMPLARDRCICLRKVEYSETSQILLLFWREHGLLRVIAKGAHRRATAGASSIDGGIDLLDGGGAVFTAHPRKELITL